MRIKHHKNRNSYILTSDGIWIRDFTKEFVSSIDISGLTKEMDYKLFLENELANRKLNTPNIDSENFFHPHVLIVSDGHDFQDKHRLLSSMPSHVTIIAVNGALAKWELVGPACRSEDKRSIDYYVVNNPFVECVQYIPKKNRYYPKCIASIRTNPNFTRIYNAKGTLHNYTPTPSDGFKGLSDDAIYCIDDYRSPVCAALALAARFGAEKIAFLCCDESFPDERPAAIKLPNGLYTYPQHLVSQGVIDANLHWMTKYEDRDVTIVDSSSGAEYSNACYIKPDKLMAFFEGQDD